MIAWLALTLAALNTLFLVGVFVAAGRFWRQVEPQVRPLLAMFAVPTQVTSSSGGATVLYDAPDDK